MSSDRLPIDLQDHELLARQQNVRLWWRRAVTLSLIVLIASPVTAGTIWYIRHHAAQVDFTPPGTHGYAFRRVYVDYMRYEGHSNRGPYFAFCASTMQRFAGVRGSAALTEAEVLYYLGPADEAVQTSGGTGLVYYYRTVQPNDAQVIVSIVGPKDRRVLAGVTLNANAPRKRATTSPARG
jgi:hypothetical protein